MWNPFKKLDEFVSKKTQEAQQKKGLHPTEIEEIEEIEEEEEEERQQQIQVIAQARKKYYRHEKRKNIVKKTGIFFLGFLFLITMLRSFKTTKPMQVDVNQALMVETFLEEYYTNYFVFPKTKESTAFIEQFHYQGEQKLKVEQTVVKQTVEDIKVYKTEKINEQENWFYSTANLKTTYKAKEKEEVTTQRIYLKDRVLMDNKQKIIVLSNTPFVKKEIAFFNPKEKETFKSENKSFTNTTSMSEKEKEEVKNTLDLFFHTYSENNEKAFILTKGIELLPLSEGVQLELATMGSIGLNKQNQYYVSVTVNERIHDLLQNQRTYFLVLEKETKKIIRMEEQ